VNFPVYKIVSNNIIGALKMQNNSGAIKFFSINISPHLFITLSTLQEQKLLLLTSLLNFLYQF
jgi:hypothetical protein